MVNYYWVPQKLPQIYTVITFICIGKVAWLAVYIGGNIWNALYKRIYEVSKDFSNSEFKEASANVVVFNRDGYTVFHGGPVLREGGPGLFNVSGGPRDL